MPRHGSDTGRDQLGWNEDGPMRPGDKVEIFSTRANDWIKANVIKAEDKKKITVQYNCKGETYTKTMKLTSENLRFSSNVSEAPRQCLELPLSDMEDAVSEASEPVEASTRNHSGGRGGDSAAAKRAADALRRLRGEDYLRELMHLMSHKDAEFRFAATKAFQELGSGRRPVAEATAKLLESARAEVRRRAVQALSLMGDSGTTYAGRIARLKADVDPDVRLAAAETLGHMGESGAAYAAEVVELLRDPDVYVRKAASHALRKMMKCRRTCNLRPDRLGRLMQDSHPEVRQAASDVLWSMGAKGEVYRSEVARLLEDSDADTRRAVAEVLYQMRQRAAGLGTILDDREKNRKSLEDLPPNIKHSLQEVEARGWERVHWNKGISLLHWGAEHGHMDLCERLLELRADPRMQNEQGDDPIMIAQRHNHSGTYLLLVKSGALGAQEN